MLPKTSLFAGSCCCSAWTLDRGGDMLQVQHSLAPGCPLFVAHAGLSGALTTRLRLALLNNSRGTPAIQTDTVMPLRLQQPHSAASDNHASLPGLARQKLQARAGPRPEWTRRGAQHCTTFTPSHRLFGINWTCKELVILPIVGHVLQALHKQAVICRCSCHCWLLQQCWLCCCRRCSRRAAGIRTRLS